MLRLGEKVKVPQKYLKPLAYHIRVVLRKKKLQWIIRKNSLCKMLTLGEKLNWPKKCLKRLSVLFKVFFYAKNDSKRQLILKNLDHFENRQNNFFYAKAIAFMERFVGCD